MFSFLFSKEKEVEFLSNIKHICVTCYETSQLLSKVVVLLYIPISKV